MTTWLQKMLDKFPHDPHNLDELVAVLHHAKESRILSQDALAMLEGVLQVSELRASEIMIPRSQMVVLEKDATLADMVQVIGEHAHSRYPVVGEKREEVIGIILAKDLLKHVFHKPETFHIRDILRPAVFIPENKRLNALLTEFRETRHHMAMVVDEYGVVTGVVTIEDVLEQIVGDIADEHDVDEESCIREQTDGIYTVKAITDIEAFNEYFQTKIIDDECDTIGGALLKHLGYLPKRGEKVTIDALQFTILHADHRRIHLIRVNKLLEGITG